jgi:alpha-tubulin suppressor-like RCC1 family protein
MHMKIKFVFFIMLIYFISILQAHSQELPRLQHIKMIAAGSRHAIALDSNDNMWAWGTILSPKNSKWGYFSYATKVHHMEGIKDISCGTMHSVVLKTDGTVWTWGGNEKGQLGLGIKDKSIYAPTQVTMLTEIVAISTSENYTLALKNDGTVWAWGSLDYRTIGIEVKPESFAPMQIPELDHIVKIEVAPYHAIALKDDGTLWAWGLYLGNELRPSNAKFLKRMVPVQVDFDSKAIALTSGYHRTVILDSAGTIWSLGTDLEHYGENPNTKPVILNLPIRIKYIESGGTISAFISTEDVIYFWGIVGSISLNYYTYTYYPPKRLNIDQVISLAIGSDYILFLKTDGSVWSHGDNRHGLLGIGGGPSNYNDPTPVVFF